MSKKIYLTETQFKTLVRQMLNEGEFKTYDEKFVPTMEELRTLFEQDMLKKVDTEFHQGEFICYYSFEKENVKMDIDITCEYEYEWEGEYDPGVFGSVEIAREPSCPYAVLKDIIPKEMAVWMEGESMYGDMEVKLYNHQLYDVIRDFIYKKEAKKLDDYIYMNTEWDIDSWR